MQKTVYNLLTHPDRWQRFALAMLLFVAMPNPASAQPVYNIPVAAADGQQTAPQIVSAQPAEGFFVIWIDAGAGRGRLLAQRLGADGFPQWSEARVVAMENTDIREFTAVADGAGGIFLAWLDSISGSDKGTVFVSHVNKAGEPDWPEAVPAGQPETDQANPRLDNSADEGIYVVWEQVPAGSSGDFATNADIFAQHFDREGNKLWPQAGSPVVEEPEAQRLGDIAAMKKGLAVAWEEVAKNTVRFQILDMESGEPLAPAEGIRVAESRLPQKQPRVVLRPSSSAESMFVIWQEIGLANLVALRGQRFSAVAERLWGSQGKAIGASTVAEPNHQIIYDGKGQIMLVWQVMGDADIDLRGQKVDRSGRVLWNRAGVVVSDAKGDQVRPQIVPDLQDGIFCTWEDNRNGTIDVFGQRISRTGKRKWDKAGVALSEHPGPQERAAILTLPGKRLAAVWQDGRAGNADIFAQIVLQSGALDNVPPRIVSTPVPEVPAGARYTYPLQVFDIDRDEPFTFSLVQGPDWLVLDANSGELSGTAPNAPGDAFKIAVQATDARDSVAVQEFTLTLTEQANTPPVITSLPDTVVFEDSLYTYSITFEDPDAGDTHRLIGEVLPAWLAVDSSRFALRGTPQNADVGNHGVTIVVQDRFGASDRQEFTLRVLNTNDPPQFIHTAGPDTAIEDKAYGRQLDVADPDADEKLRFSLLAFPAWLSLDVTAGELSGTPDNADVGESTVTVRVEDRAGAADTLSFRLLVLNVNDAPEFTSVPDTAAFVGKLYQYRPQTQDIDAGDSVVIAIAKGPAWLQWAAAERALRGTPTTAMAEQRFAVELQARDRAGATAKQVFAVHVFATSGEDTVAPGPPPQFSIQPETWTAADSVSLHWITPGDASGVARLFVKLLEPPASKDDYQQSYPVRSAAGEADSTAIFAAEQGEVAVFFWFADAAGNADIATASQATYRVDRTPPGPPVALFPASWSRSDSIRFAWLATVDSVSGLAGYALQIEPQGRRIEVTPAEPRGDTLEVTLALALEGKTFTWSVIAQDSAGNETPSTPLSVSVDNVPPLLVHSPVDTAQIGAPISIESLVTDFGAGVEQVELWYRTTGSRDKQRLPMARSTDDLYRATVPGAALVAEGFEYTIVASDIAGNRQKLPVPGDAGFRSVVILSHGVSTPFATAANDYQMFSVPFSPAASLQAFFENNLGAYNDTRWRLLRYQDGAYVELTVGEIDSLLPGRAYWLITREPATLATGAGASVRSDLPFVITLRPGWNMIGTPFPFATAVAAAKIPAGVEKKFWGYAGGYRLESVALQPWRGYFIKNNSAEDKLMLLYPVQPPPTAKTASEWPGVAWLGRLSVDIDGLVDAENYFGVAAAASDASDSLDFSEPPAIGRVPRLYFYRATGDGQTEALAGDFRSPSGQLQWHVAVENLTAGNLTFRLQQIKPWPDSLVCRIEDLETGARRLLEPGQPISFLNSAPRGQREFVLQFVPKNMAKAPAVLPAEITLYPLRPNPFRRSRNGKLIVRFALASPAAIELRVYNLLGQEVWAYRSPGTLSAGEHALAWNAASKRQRRVANGIYLVTLRSGRTRLQQKVLILH